MDVQFGPSTRLRLPYAAHAARVPDFVAEALARRHRIAGAMSQGATVYVGVEQLRDAAAEKLVLSGAIVETHSAPVTRGEVCG